MKLLCEQCGEPFERPKFRKFCSSDCYHLWSRGRINKGPKTLDHRQKLSASLKGVSHVTEAFLSPKRGEKISAARKGMKFEPSHLKALSEVKIRFLEAGGFHGRQSEYISLKTGERNWAHSGFERELMLQLDANDDVMSWTKNHGIRIPYVYNGQRMYVPDFRVETRDGLVIVMEAKGYEFEPAKCRAKADAAETFCDDMGWTYLVVNQSSRLLSERKGHS